MLIGSPPLSPVTTNYHIYVTITTLLGINWVGFVGSDLPSCVGLWNNLPVHWREYPKKWSPNFPTPSFQSLVSTALELQGYLVSVTFSYLRSISCDSHIRGTMMERIIVKNLPQK